MDLEMIDIVFLHSFTRHN